MATIAEIAWEPGDVISWLVCIFAWLIVGWVVGWLAGRIRRGGYGIIGDVRWVVALGGAVIGGLLFRLAVTGWPGFLGSLVAAIIVACILIAVVRAVAPGRDEE
jgi:uncharacterized membrane protein YeaQ/YmgE (transglycosylase-associated protein family)